MTEMGRHARDIIAKWEPDLVYINDDNAQQYVTKYFLNQSIPFVFSGMNALPDKYGFTGSTNITGILEQEHFIQTIALLKELDPKVRLPYLD